MNQYVLTGLDLGNVFEASFADKRKMLAAGMAASGRGQPALDVAVVDDAAAEGPDGPDVGDTVATSSPELHPS